MNRKPKRLLFTAEPFGDESFIGYIMRLAELNEISDIRWILASIRPGKIFKYSFKYNFDFRINVLRLSQLIGVEKEILGNLLYLHTDSQIRGRDETLSVFNKSIPYDLIQRENPKICPRCLSDQNYCRKIWEIALVTTCPVHQCLLLDYCPNCLEKLNWERPEINVCQCKFDFRQAEIFHLKEIELRLSKYLYHHFNLNTGQPEFSFAFPLKTLSFFGLTKLLLFTAAHFSPIYDSEGNNFFKYLSNNRLHAYMTAAVTVFESWADNYHIFIRDWHKWETRGYLGRRKVDLRDPQLYFATYEYEIFNFVLYEYFNEKQFAFLSREFEHFIEKFNVEGFSDQPLLFDKYK